MTKYVEHLNYIGNKPNRQHASDAGYDLVANEDKWLLFRKPTLVKTGTSIQLPKNTVGDIRPRSGNSKRGIDVSYGTVDSGYTGEIKVNMRSWFHYVKKGDRIAQLVVLPLVHFTDVVKKKVLKPTDRGDNGFGSTGVK